MQASTCEWILIHNTNQRIIKYKVGLLSITVELANFSKADSFHVQIISQGVHQTGASPFS
jgi:hypothetical protein